MTLQIITPETTEHYDALRELCWDYRDFLLGLGPEDVEIVRTFYPREKYARLMETLETAHAPPNGAARLAVLGDQPVGCAMSHRFLPGAAEIKRVFVRDEARGLGAGRALMHALIDQCRQDGFERILMDTGTPLKAAQNLYLSMGFRLRGPYQKMPDIAKDRVIFF